MYYSKCVEHFIFNEKIHFTNSLAHQLFIVKLISKLMINHLPISLIFFLILLIIKN